MSPRSLSAALCLLFSALAYLVFTAANVPLLKYAPSIARWAFTLPTGVIGMDWFYRAAMSLLAGALGAALGAPVARRLGPLRAASVTRFTFGIAFAMMLWGAMYTSLALSTTPRGRDAHGGEEH